MLGQYTTNAFPTIKSRFTVPARSSINSSTQGTIEPCVHNRESCDRAELSPHIKYSSSLSVGKKSGCPPRVGFDPMFL